MQFKELPVSGAYLIELDPFRDNRGQFSRLFCQNELREIGHQNHAVQINHSVNYATGALRGMHFQHSPMAEIKMIKCIRGAVFDVIVDLRSDSPTLLNWHAVELNERNHTMIYIPKGCAHGFQTLEPNSELLYFHSQFYSTEHEGAIHHNDPLVNIRWPLPVSEISEKDAKHPFLEKSFSGFNFE